MTAPADAALHRLWTLLDAQAWDDLPGVLADDVRVEYVHDGSVMDRDAFVRFNRDYPGRWRCEVIDAITDGDRVVGRVKVFDDENTFWFASFATVRDGVIVELTEVWTDAVAPRAQTPRAQT